MARVNSYLNFKGNTEEAFNFYKLVFDTEFTVLQRYKDTPEGDKIPAKDQNKIMHIALPVGNGNVLMGTDSLESAGHKLKIGNNFHLSLNTDSEAEATKLFNDLSKGGKTTMPLQKTFWNSYFGMFTDKFGIQWMVNYSYPK
ncbi:MAG: VOC family protein [Candidatus Omnitrophica bacterium]|nr:VOC family protein [Candidatus Omnitrophota bacterium]